MSKGLFGATVRGVARAKVQTSCKDRNLSKVNVVTSESRLAGDIEVLDRAADQKETMAMLVAIISELPADPRKLKKCKRMVHSDVLLPSAEGADAESPDRSNAYKWYWKLPKEFVQDAIQQVCPTLSLADQKY